MDDIVHEVKDRFREAVERNPAQAILLSGGLDSTLAALCAKTPMAISVELMPYSEDRRYAERVARHLGLAHHFVQVRVDEALKTVPAVIGVLKSFDPAIPNDVAVFCGLSYAKDKGIGSVMTGDGSDEVFAGYSFMRQMGDLGEYLNRMHASMRFGANEIGRSLGISIRQPFLDKDFFTFAKEIALSYKIVEEGGITWGKWILRKAFEEMLPGEILWQSKRPCECGSGMTRLRGIIESMVSDSEYERATRLFPVRFRSKEHYYYYRIYRERVGEIPAPEEGQKRCGGCGAGMDASAFHCKVCGSVEDWRLTGGQCPSVAGR
ncbi:MAG: asparagine synthase C-terminal domain-containing protein [Syntrophales bacterium]|nr:asparagine synthase C-terminal domain-containing protein [Syntrophales bacterium]